MQVMEFVVTLLRLLAVINSFTSSFLLKSSYHKYVRNGELYVQYLKETVSTSIDS